MQEVYLGLEDNEETWETMAKQFYPNKLNASEKED